MTTNSAGIPIGSAKPQPVPYLCLAERINCSMSGRAVDAVARLPLPGGTIAAGPFAEMTRTQLEAIAAALRAGWSRGYTLGYTRLREQRRTCETG